MVFLVKDLLGVPSDPRVIYIVEKYTRSGQGGFRLRLTLCCKLHIGQLVEFIELSTIAGK